MFQYGRLTQAAASSYLSRARPLAERKVCSLVFARTFLSQPCRVGMRRSQTPAATKLGTEVPAHKLQNMTCLLIEVAEVPAKNMPSLIHASTSPEQQLNFLQQTGKNP
ncbi:unnamed protein product [Sphagnum balticum]